MALYLLFWTIGFCWVNEFERTILYLAVCFLQNNVMYMYMLYGYFKFRYGIVTFVLDNWILLGKISGAHNIVFSCLLYKEHCHIDVVWLFEV